MPAWLVGGPACENLTKTNVEGLTAHTLTTQFLTYAVGQMEVCPSTNRIHMQFYIITTAKTTLTGLKKGLGSWFVEAHFVPATETQRSTDCVRDYCQKDETRLTGATPFEYGVYSPGRAGARSLDDLRSMLGTAGCATWEEAIESGIPWDLLGRSHTFVKEVLQLRAPRRSPDCQPRFIRLIGESGTGKTWYVHKHFPEAYWWTMAGTGGFWITIDAAGKSVIVLDDYRSWIPFGILLRCIDRGRLTLPCKGGQVEICATTWIFTSNLPMREWYAKMRDEHPVEWEVNMKALERRFNDFGEEPDYHAEYKSWRAEQRVAALERAFERPLGGAAPAAPRRLSPEPMLEADERYGPPSSQEQSPWASPVPVVWEQEYLPDSPDASLGH